MRIQMNIEKRRKQLIAIALVSSILVLAGTMLIQASTANDEDGNLIQIVGGFHVKINRFISNDFRFSPGTIHVRHGGKITVFNLTPEAHTFSLVDPSLLPTTVNDVLSCGSNFTVLDICTAIFFAHAPPNAPSYCNFAAVGAPPGTPPLCQYIDNGAPSSTPPVLDTVFTLRTGGDSIGINPGQMITMTVNAPAGTVLHFLCGVHPWMQGAIVVTGNGNE